MIVAGGAVNAMNDNSQINAGIDHHRALKYRLQFEDLVLQISTHFINASLEQIDAAINDTLKEIGMFCKTDNANIYTFSDDLSTFGLTYSWSSEQLSINLNDHTDLVSTDNMWWFSRMKAQQVIAVPSVLNMPDEAAHERQSLLERGISAMVDVPMINQGKLVGSMGFYSIRDNRHWTDDEIALLRIVSQVLTNALQRKIQEEALQKYAHIVSSSSDLLALVDGEYRFQAASNSYFNYFGFQRDQIIGKTVADIVGDHYFQTVIKPKADECLTGKEVQFQSWMEMPDGRKCCFDTHYSPHHAKGLMTIVGYVISARDISDQKKLEDQLRQAYKMEAIGTLAGGIAHDFNNILSAVIGYAEICRSTMKKGSDAYNYVQHILDAGNRASDLVKQILTFSRQTEQVVSPVQIKPIIKEAMKLIRASLPVYIEIKQDLASDNYVMADPTQIHQIIMNLCTNAGYAMKNKNGVLSVKLIDMDVNADHIASDPELRPGRYVQLSVSDTGAGIARNIRDRIFDPFFTTKPRNEGTGMGLSLVHGIVKSYQGAITLKTRKGVGSTFNVLIPAFGDKTDAPVDAGQREVPRGTEHVLFIDDEASLVEIGQHMLEGLGYRVTPVIGSYKALQLFGKKPEEFDLVITDYTMPNLRGDQLACRLLKIRPDIPIIMVTGFADTVAKRYITHMGIRALIQKPILLWNIATAIRAVLDKH